MPILPISKWWNDFHRLWILAWIGCKTENQIKSFTYLFYVFSSLLHIIYFYEMKRDQFKFVQVFHYTLPLVSQTARMVGIFAPSVWRRTFSKLGSFWEYHYTIQYRWFSLVLCLEWYPNALLWAVNYLGVTFWWKLLLLPKFLVYVNLNRTKIILDQQFYSL